MKPGPAICRPDGTRRFFFLKKGETPLAGEK
jgi:hypothetical protein